ncbi:MAG: hypothetical protein ACW99A_04395 [Candidatus Kariarchaeaceae archaeon]|jgi:hypothetical protein
MSFNWNKDEINVKISRLLDTIVNLANEDNVISDDEDVIIEAARQKLWGLHSDFEKMIDQNLSIEEAKSQTMLLLEQVITGVTDAAKKDKKITSDELVLIDRIAKFLRNTDFTDLLN